MLVRRRNWLYRRAGQLYAHAVRFDRPMTSAGARMALQRSVGGPLELWGRTSEEVLQLGNKRFSP